VRITAPATALGGVLALTLAGLAQVSAGAESRTPAPAARPATRTIDGVRVTRGPAGTARTLAVSGETRVAAVDRTTAPRTAARAHLARYAALLGLRDPGTTLVGGRVTRSVTGDDVVRFRERRDGLPVIGGAVAVDLRPSRQLGSVTASVSRATVPGASYPASTAREQALAVAAKRLGHHDATALSAGPATRRLYDPAVLGVPRTSDPTTRARGVWRVEVRGGPAFHRLMLVDDRTGALVLDADLVEQVDRVVCDDQNAPDTTDVPCRTVDAVRTEGQPPTGTRDADDAYDLAAVVSRFYRRIGRLDLTRLLGVDEGAHKSLSSTVRFCDFLDQADCPLQNAFWNGLAMFYGQGFASADDVVGHEMTHGVISHDSDLFYWGQSGAINESLADIMGEIIDHRHHTRGESRHSWNLGEDLPIGAIRNMQNPRKFGQPESMSSKRYVRGLFDNGGVHTNSGVGNRTFYLISQGGRQGGQTVRGIDGRSLKKSATLYLAVIQHLVSGSDYADLASVLDHSCRALARHHQVGMSKADCRNVHRATLATRLRDTPRRAKQPADAPMTCPRGTGPVRVLFDSEQGTPASRFDAGSTWLRAPRASVVDPVPANATSGRRSWFSFEPIDITVSSLTMHPVALPVGRKAYLWFHQWRLLESVRRFDGTVDNNDGGTVEVADTTRGRGPKPAERLPWVNGPRDRITGEFGNPAGGRRSFSGDSRGYLASRLALERYAGHTVSPQFTMNTDNSGQEIGWYLDDIRVYACGRGPMPRTAPRISGTPIAHSTLTAHPGRWSRSRVQSIRWYADGVRIPGATGTSYVVRAADVGKRISVKVTAVAHQRHTSTFSGATVRVTSA
jgi:bacillolysin